MTAKCVFVLGQSWQGEKRPMNFARNYSYEVCQKLLRERKRELIKLKEIAIIRRFKRLKITLCWNAKGLKRVPG